MPKQSDSAEQWGSQKSVERGASARRYAYLFSSNMQVPDIRVDMGTWDRIAHGLPKAYTMPDEMMLDWMYEWVNARRQVDEEMVVEKEQVEDEPTE